MSEWEELLKQHGYIMEDVDDAFKAIEERLKNKKHVWEKTPLGERKKREVGKYITHRSTHYPLKLFVLQEFGTIGHMRLGYYVVSLKKLRDEGKISVVWGQFNASFIEKDLKQILDKARSKGIISLN